MCKEVQAAFGLFSQIDDGSDADSLVDVFKAQLEEVGNKHSSHQLLLIVDAINQFDAAHRSQELQWLPSQLPAVRFILVILADNLPFATEC